MAFRQITQKIFLSPNLSSTWSIHYYRRLRLFGLGLIVERTLVALYTHKIVQQLRAKILVSTINAIVPLHFYHDLNPMRNLLRSMTYKRMTENAFAGYQQNMIYSSTVLIYCREVQNFHQTFGLPMAACIPEIKLYDICNLSRNILHQLITSENVLYRGSN